MFDALYVGATGMRGQQLQIDTIAHNLANVNTIGFRRNVTTFAEVSAALQSARTFDLTRDDIANVVARGAGVMSTVTASSQAGELKPTGEPLDIAIDGAGFFEVIRADGTPAYTRAGKFKIDADGTLTTVDGSSLASRIDIPTDARQVTIQPNGHVTALVGDADEPIDIGQFELVTFANPAALQAAGNNLHVAPAAAGDPRTAAPGEDGVGVLRQGFVESSNVQLTDELVSLMLAQRGFELNARVVQAADQMLSITNSLFR
jgi:flagellar basal-body rod protein FlgG